ncbi:helix-turn-helix domain-containing protein [Lysobacter sp. 2RAF19]|jgi:transcriptional regulator with XRE-family HTH domain
MKREQALFGERLRSALKAAGYRQSASEIAYLIVRHGGDPTTPQAVSRWLNGKSIPRQRNLIVLAHLLRIEPTALQYGTEATSRVRETRVEFRIPAMDQHAIDAFIALPPKARKVVRELIETLRENEQKRKR